MKNRAIILAASLCYAILVLFVERAWGWSLFQVVIFALAAWQAVGFDRPRLPRLLVPLAAAAVWPLVQLALGTTISPERTWEQALSWFTFLMIFAVSCNILNDRCALRALLGTACVFGMLIAAAGTVQRYSSGGRIFWLFDSGFATDVIGPFVNRNQFAAWIELLLPPSLYLAATDRYLRPLFGVAAACMFGALIASASRAGFVIGCGEVLAVGISLSIRQAAPRRTLAFLITQFAVLGTIAALIAGWQGLQTRLAATGLEALRVDAARASVQMVLDKPWSGSGLGTWPMLYPRYASLDTGVVVNQAHNDWLQWAAEGGLPFLLFVGIFAGLLWKRAAASIYGLGTVAFLLHAAVDYPMQQRPALAAWFFAMAGATAAWPGGFTRSR